MTSSEAPDEELKTVALIGDFSHQYLQPRAFTSQF
jgi:hypothetical protein